MPVLSWLFIAERHAQRERRTHSWSIPRGGYDTSSSSTLRPHPITVVPRLASYPSPFGQVLRANPFPEVADLICRLPLPTLFYQLEAIHLGDLLRILVRSSTKINWLPWIFKGRRKRSKHHRSRGVLREQCPYLWPNQFHGFYPLKRKENSSWNFRRRLQVRLRYRLWPSEDGFISVSRFRNINRIPFRSIVSLLNNVAIELTFGMAFAYSLGSTDPCPTAVHKEPFSTSVFKVLTWIFATTTKIYTDGGSRRVFTRHLQRPPSRPSYSLRLGVRKRYMSVAAEYRPEAQAPSIFRASWFGRWVVTHSLAVSNFHGHRPAVYINQHLSWGLMSFYVRRLISAFGSSHSASSAYQKWPTWSSFILMSNFIYVSSTSYPFKVWE